MQSIRQKEITIVPDKKIWQAARVSILETLAYFDIFNYPLLLSEIKQYNNRSLNESLIEDVLLQLIDERRVFRFYDLYSLHDNFSFVEKRILGNLRAEKLIPKALRAGGFLFKFPFVRGVAISGSLSKNYADEKADIDFFIITKSDRLWIARTIMHIFKKLTFLFGRQHFYCMNYYIDETSLLIEEKNIFTAIEIKTLLPVTGRETLETFYSLNDWTNNFLPACSHRQVEKSESKSVLKELLEWIFHNKVGNFVDNCLMRLTTKRWRKKTQKGKKNEKGQRMELLTGKHFARSNPESFQERILMLYKQKLNDLKLRPTLYPINSFSEE